ncbi:hypothetical protein Mnod_8340 (plasmid) [Methylobacterium nodulans ORS 2060]|uniref:Transposase n=1 Tax=Methylobacterium nodulans (strain LMG 21967 / CNCM I-2342 / ORS 2060) TaxID=460265 RepID=B8IVN8_METNO|nr:hypothetical protein Mnod_8340 [Methylobacterium nodulans ORS 2060]
MILTALALKLKRQAHGDFKGRHFEAALIVQAVFWSLRCALSLGNELADPPLAIAMCRSASSRSAMM